MIRNRNMVFSTANDDSRNEDKRLELPQIATASRPTAAAAIDGALYYDETTNLLTVCIDGAWRTVDTTAE
jgi:hypothetical protein